MKTRRIKVGETALLVGLKPGEPGCTSWVKAEMLVPRMEGTHDSVLCLTPYEAERAGKAFAAAAKAARRLDEMGKKK